jgi:hypothetical protein
MMGEEFRWVTVIHPEQPEQEPAERPCGVEAIMRDNSGNWLVLVEPGE